MKLKTGAFIKEVQLEMEQFSAALKVYAMAEFERFAQMGDDVNNNDMDQLPDELVTLIAESDVLQQHLEASKENIDSKVGDQDSNITKELTRDWTATQTRILEEQHQRNRTIVQEIIKTCERFKKEISKYLYLFANGCRGGSGSDRKGEEPLRMITHTLFLEISGF